MPTVGESTTKSGKKPPDFTRLFEFFGMEFSGTGVEKLAAECPWCGKDRCHVNIETGQYHCKHCEAKGNVTTFLTWIHGQVLSCTTDDDYRALKEKRGIAIQTLKRHGLAYDERIQGWLIPFRNPGGNVVNIQIYYPDRVKGNKFNLRGLPTALYGLDRLSTDRKKPLYLCEGVFDAIALDYRLGIKRSRYDILAAPGMLKECWIDHFRGREVRATYDNDDGGETHRQRARKLLGESGVAGELLLLKWPDGYPDGYDINDLVREHPKVSVPAFTLKHSVRVVAEPKLIIHHGRRQSGDEREARWVWPHHLRCGTYASFSGRQGTFKTTIMLWIAAQVTTGKPLPTMKGGRLAWEKVGIPAGDVLYIYAEDNRDEVENGFEWAGGDFSKWHSMPAVKKDGDPLNILEHLTEIEANVREHAVQMVVIDGQNSVVGAPNISTDMLARNNVTNKLHQFAQRLDVCLVGIRNEDVDGRALGPQSFGDIGRCVMRAVEKEPVATPPYCELLFPKVSDTARVNYPPIPYSIENLGGSHREILWGKDRPKVNVAAQGGKGKPAVRPAESNGNGNGHGQSRLTAILGAARLRLHEEKERQEQSGEETAE